MEFLPSATVLSAFAIATLVLAITPGPDMTLFLSRSITQSRLAGLMCFAGASTGILIHTLLAALGISALIQASPNAFWLLKLAGAVYLLWLAIQAVRIGTSFDLKLGEQKKISLFENWLMGIGINLLNPKIVLFFITFLPQFVLPTDPNAVGKMIFLGFLFTIIATIVCVPMIVAVEKFSNKLQEHPKIIRFIDWVFASIFSVFAIRILFLERS